MVDGWTYALVLIATVGSAVMSGIFFSFSNFMMQALHRLPAAQGIAAMQSINAVIATPLFVLVLLGTAASCAGLIALSWSRLGEDGAALVVAGSALYLVGCLFVTIAYHVPRNQALDRWDPSAPSSHERWERFVPRWIAWNHLRTLASLASVVTFVLAMRAGS